MRARLIDRREYTSSSVRAKGCAIRRACGAAANKTDPSHGLPLPHGVGAFGGGAAGMGDTNAEGGWGAKAFFTDSGMSFA